MELTTSRRWGGVAAIVLAVAFVCVGGAWAFGMGVWWLLPPPPEAVADGVVREGPLLEQALARAPARLYLVDFELQERLTSCAPASVRNLLVSSDHAVESERALFDAQPVGWMRMLVLGMTLEQVAGLLEHNEAGQVEIARDLDYAAFLAHLERTNDPAWRYLVNFDRDPVFGVSIGHFSPLGGYDAASGLVTLLDVTPGYGMSLIPAPLLYEAITTVDPDSGLGRGLVAVRLDAATP